MSLHTKIKEKIAEKDKTIYGRIMSKVILMLLIPLLILGIISSWLSYSSTNGVLEQNMRETAKVAAQRVQWELQSYKNLASDLGATARLARKSVSVKEKEEIVEERVEAYDMVRGDVIGSDGVSLLDDTDYSSEEYFQSAMKGETVVSEPVVSEGKNGISIVIAAPLWEDGIMNSKVVGVVCLVPKEEFSNEIVVAIQVSKNGSAYMIDGSGTVIAHKNMDSVINQENTMEDAKKDSSLKAIAAMEKEMTEGKEGFGTYKYGGTKKIMAYAPVEKTNHWSIAITAPSSDFMFETILGIIITVVVIIVSIISTVILVRKLAGEIGKPIKACANRLKLLAEGDLHTEIPEVKTEDETKILAQATADIVKGMESIIGDIRYLLIEMSNNNFNVHTGAEASYVGDFKEILVAVRKINYSLSDTLKQIKEVAGQVALGSEQLSQSGQSLAEGSTEQAGAVEELLATVGDVTTQVAENTKNAVDTSKKARQIGEEAESSSSHITDMMQAMERINDASMQIANIIGAIEQIADQTNLLSLNASIEAARAGEAGKGFAVVAGEIGQLANQSASSVDDTRRLIEAAVSEVEHGNGIADSTANALQSVISGIQEIVKAVELVAEYSDEQNNAMHQINQAIEQISGVIQSNSALAQESSATSEELSAQAIELDELIEKFTLREN